MLSTVDKLWKEYEKGVTVSEKLQDTYDFIKQHDKEGSCINSFINLTEELAFKQANKKFDPSKPLSGVMLGVKDNIHVDGFKTTCASAILSNYQSIYDATVITKLKEAGAIIVGKCNLDEFAMGACGITSYFGATKNPYDTKRVAGGSSSGSAASVGKGFVNMSLGSDTGGSVRVPAAYCNAVGLKPTYGSVSRYGVMAMSSGLDQIGPIAHSALDCALLFNVIKGYDQNDMNSIEHPGVNLENIKNQKSIKKIGLIKQFLSESEDFDPQIQKYFFNFVQKLKEIGYEVIEIDFPEIVYSLQTYFILSRVQSFSALSMIDGIRYGVRHQAETLDEVYRLSRTQGFHPEIIKRILTGNYILSSTSYYNKARRVQTLLFNKLQDIYKQVDVMISPTFLQKAPLLDSDSFTKVSSVAVDMITSVANLTGIPALTAPIGKDEEGFPLAVHIMSNLKQEELLFELAYQVESL